MPLCVENCQQIRDGKVILERVSLSINHGEIVAVVGPSGSGKTTLMRCISGLDQPSGGRVLMEGKTIDDVGGSHWRADVVYCAQDRYSSGFRATPQDMARYIGQLHAVRQGDLAERAHALSTKLGLNPEKFTASWQTLSGGEQARCRLSIVLAQRPAYILLDEPSASLDPKSAALLEDEVRNTGCGVLWVTHNEDQAARFDRIHQLTGHHG